MLRNHIKDILKIKLEKIGTFQGCRLIFILERNNSKIKIFNFKKNNKSLRNGRFFYLATINNFSAVVLNFDGFFFKTDEIIINL
jgi:hypothetical protein